MQVTNTVCLSQMVVTFSTRIIVFLVLKMQPFDFYILLGIYDEPCSFFETIVVKISNIIRSIIWNVRTILYFIMV